MSSNEEIFNNQKTKYEEALEKSGYSAPYFKKKFGNVDGYDGKNLKYIPRQEHKNKKKWKARDAGPSEGLKIWGCQYYLVGIIFPPWLR